MTLTITIRGTTLQGTGETETKAIENLKVAWNNNARCIQTASWRQFSSVRGQTPVTFYDATRS